MSDDKPITRLHDGLLQKRSVIKVTRTQYGLILGVRANAKELKRALANIPDDAIVVDEENYDGRGLSTNSVSTGTVYIFEVERRELP